MLALLVTPEVVQARAPRPEARPKEHALDLAGELRLAEERLAYIEAFMNEAQVTVVSFEKLLRQIRTVGAPGLSPLPATRDRDTKAAELRHTIQRIASMDRALAQLDVHLRALAFAVGAQENRLYEIVQDLERRQRESSDGELRSLLDRASRVLALSDQGGRRLAVVRTTVAATWSGVQDERDKTIRLLERSALRYRAKLARLFTLSVVVGSGGGCVKSYHSPVRLSDLRIATLARDAGFEDYDLAVATAVALAESGGDPFAGCVNTNGSRDQGLWQINSIHGVGSKCTLDPRCNAKTAFEVYSRSGRSFTPWVAYDSGAFVVFLERGSRAALQLGHDPFAVFDVCPVDRPHSYSDDFGAPRVGHLHAGNDIFAAEGTPVRAPFDGEAFASPNGLGGNAVVVSGSRGHVYNAHLSAYGKLGFVRAGTIVGYVGNTGNAASTPPHNHFEWHPGGGQPVNPFPYLNAACR